MSVKNFYYNLLLVLLIGTVSISVTAQQFDVVDEVPHDISYFRTSRISPPLVKVLYGRPSKKNEKVFGSLIPYGEIWRTGHNEATEVKFYHDLKFGDTKVKAGTYVLLTIPYEKEWRIILNTQLDTWGAFQYNPLFNVAEISVPTRKAEELETFSIVFKQRKEHIEMILGWDTTRVRVPLQFKEQRLSVAHRIER